MSKKRFRSAARGIYRRIIDADENNDLYLRISYGLKILFQYIYTTDKPVISKDIEEISKVNIITKVPFYKRWFLLKSIYEGFKRWFIK